MAHLDQDDRSAYFATLEPGSDLDHRGTTFTAELLDALLNALIDPGTSRPCLRQAQFDRAVFSGDARFRKVEISGNAQFHDARFAGDAHFENAIFTGDAHFNNVMFAEAASFVGATFSSDAWFQDAAFSRVARFDRADFSGTARFDRTAFESCHFDDATFSSAALFDDTRFSGDAQFQRASFTGDLWFNRSAFSRTARFSEANFSGVSRFNGASFSGDTHFQGANFSGEALFSRAGFSGDARFQSALFSGDATFSGSTFSDSALFNGVVFSASAAFSQVAFSATAWFLGTSFAATAWFDDAVFAASARFDRAVFEATSELGPLVCAERMNLSRAEFRCPVTLQIAVRHLECRRTRWASRAELRLRYAKLDLSDAVFEYMMSVTARRRPWPSTAEGLLQEGALSDVEPTVRVASLRGVDAAHLVLADVDLTECLFSGTVHLDQLRLEGECSLAKAPVGVRRRGFLPVHWTLRRTLAEEQHWRASQGEAGWAAAPEGVEVLGPAALAPVYRQLRKSFEDGKNEPDAADFYYGEMEMRRKDPQRPAAERGLLAAYWAASGYGLRAMRALSWLGVAMAATILVMLAVGLPDTPARPYPGYSHVIGEQAPQLRCPLNERFTADRTEKATYVVLNSVIFRSSGQDLTTLGAYVEKGARLAEPVLLGLAALAVRGRIKRG